MEFNQIIENVSGRQDKILSSLNFEDVSVYVFLKDEYSKGNILNNFVFQFVFKAWYGLNNAGLSDEIKNRYFSLLADRQTDLEIILSELYEIPTLNGNNAIQFVFATKLLHTINNNKPIFDSQVGNIINMRVRGSSKNEKIDSCIEIYDYLKDLYTKLITNKRIKEVISKFRLKFNVDTEKISDTKILDFIIWSLGRLN